jgi:hypothetical protein
MLHSIQTASMKVSSMSPRPELVRGGSTSIEKLTCAHCGKEVPRQAWINIDNGVFQGCMPCVRRVFDMHSLRLDVAKWKRRTMILTLTTITASGIAGWLFTLVIAMRH